MEGKPVTLKMEMKKFEWAWRLMRGKIWGEGEWRVVFFDLAQVKSGAPPCHPVLLASIDAFLSVCLDPQR